MRVKVLHLIWALDLGGAERQVIEIVRHLDRSRYEPIVGCLVRVGRWGEALKAAGIPVFDLNKSHRLDLACLVRLVRLMRKEKVSIVHTHAFTAATWGRLAAAIARVPVVIAHEHSAFTLASVWRRMVDRLLIPLTQQWLPVSQELAGRLVSELRLPRDKVSIIRNGIEPTREHRALDELKRTRRELAGDRFQEIIATVGRSEDRKGLDVLLEAAALLRQRRPRLATVLIGEGPQRRFLERRAEELNIGECTVFPGRSEEVRRLLPAIDVFILPSYTEGLSIALLEAAAAGCPIVATDVGGNGEVIQDGVTGLLVPPGDSQALADSIETLLQDRTRAKTLGDQAAAVVRREFPVEGMVRQIEQVYERCLGAAGPPATVAKATNTSATRRTIRRLTAAGTMLASPEAKPPNLRILTYHRVNDSHPADRLTVHPREFRKQMEELRRTGKTVVSVERALAGLLGDEPVPPDSVAITFDDGFRDNFDFALPVLEELGLSATFFISTAFIDSSRVFERYQSCCDQDEGLSWEQVEELLNRGHGIGGHTRNHRELPSLDAVDLLDEVCGCREDISNRAHHFPKLFSYPRGKMNRLVRQMVLKAGFAGACTVAPGANGMGVDPLALRRTEVSGDDTIDDFLFKLRGGFDGWHRSKQTYDRLRQTS